MKRGSKRKGNRKVCRQHSRRSYRGGREKTADDLENGYPEDKTTENKTTEAREK